ncbi:MAG: OmpH family outer membrane protein [Verrucomicrobiae bacterium]|nr:OmpH family outer membrane protein [Verrucomicrobiae bacterium]
MKRIVCAAALLVGGLLAFSTPVQAQGQVRIAVVDLKKVFDGYWRRHQADAQLKERAAEFEKVRNGLIEDFRKANAELATYAEAAQDPALSADEREKRKQEFDKKGKDLTEQEASIRTFDQNSRQAIAKQMESMRESVLKDIRSVVEEKARTGGFSLVIDVASVSFNQTPVVLYSSLAGTDVDLSDTVLTQLNLNAPPGALPKPDAAADDKK